jgi:hypothetical protein
MTSWKTTDGNKFRGEPAGIIGPLAIFKTGKVDSSKILLTLLAPADCVRFYNELDALGIRGDDWANASGRITKEIYGAARHLDNGHLVEVSLDGVPEPEYVLLARAIYDRKRTWDVMKFAIDEYKSLKEQFPTKFEAFFHGERMGELAYLEVATDINLPWLIPDLADRNRMDSIRELLPTNGPALLLVTRGGTIVAGTYKDDEAEVNKTMATIAQLFALDRRGAIASMKEREYFYRAVQPVEFASGSCDPLIVADPISREALKLAGVTKLEATIEVGADGSVTNLTMSEDNTLTEELSGNLSKALSRARFVPAVTNGEWVAGTFKYSLD